MENLKKKFTEVYTKNLWGSKESHSGPGSELKLSKYFSDNLVLLIEKYNIKSIFDTSCGDWNWMKEIKDKLPKYVGNDIVDDLIIKNKQKYESDTIKFICGDMIESLKLQNNIDLVICRHTLEHLPSEYITEFLTLLVSKTKYALITSGNRYGDTLPNLNFDGKASRTINLDVDNFKIILGEPIEKFIESDVDSEIGTFGYFYKF